MSTIDEVLAAAEVVDAVCVIDGETRIISVPTEYKELGVESDEKVTRVKFQCPKIVGDNIDLTEYNLYINYKNASNKLNSYLVEDATVTGDTINFSWLLSRHVTESPGTISYIVCAKKSDDTGVINEWNTKVATGIVGIGLEATEEIEEQNIDAIEQILRSIVELENKVGGGGSGEAGGYYAPAVDADGNLSWTASKADMPAVDGTNIKGPQGKSAYAYAVEGGYTGTEAEFAAKLAAEKFANPNALTFTGAVTGSYDGAEPLTVNIPSSGGGSGGGEAEFPNWRLIKTISFSADIGFVEFNTDDNGNTFSLKEIMLAGSVPAYSGYIYMKPNPVGSQNAIWPTAAKALRWWAASVNGILKTMLAVSSASVIWPVDNGPVCENDTISRLVIGASAGFTADGTMYVYGR